MPCIVADIFFCNFAGCSALASIECSSWDTSSVTDMAGMFFCCLLLSAADVSSWDVSRVTSCDRMFVGCSFRRSASQEQRDHEIHEDDDERACLNCARVCIGKDEHASSD